MRPQASVPQPTGPPQPLSQTQAHPQTPPPNQQLHPEIRSVVQLNHAHAHKVYFSGPLLRKLEYNTDGQKPIKDEGWSEIWAQLGGTTLSVWDMKEIEAASKQGKEVPPSYINITDARIQIVAAVTAPATPTSPARRLHNVMTVNTAGSNLYLFSCQSIPALTSWVAALRLAAWEKSRLDEIYTAHLIRITLIARDVPTTLVKGKMEGWTRIRVAGQRDWRKVWMVVQEGSSDQANDQLTGPATNGNAAAPPAVIRKRRVSNIFSSSSTPNNGSSVSLPSKSFVSIYASPKPRDRKKALLTITNVSQVFAVYPERPEMISKSTLMKLEGFFEDGELAGSFIGIEGWAFLMPEGEKGSEKSQVQGGGLVAEMLKWIVALHDAFRLYGRPGAWTWDPRDPVSLMYGYPVGTMKETLFLDREIAEKIGLKEGKTSSYRVGFKNLLQQHMRLPVQIVNPQKGGQPPAGVSVGGLGTGLDGANLTATGVSNGALPPLPQSRDTLSSPMNNTGIGGPQLPPLAFGSGDPATTNVPNNATNPDVNNVPTNNNNGPSSRLSTIEESSMATHNENQHQRPTDLQGPGPGVGGSFIYSLPPPPHRPEIFGAPAVPAKSPPSPVADASTRQLHPSNVSSPLSQSQPQPLQGSTTTVVPPRFQNQSQGGSGNSTPGSRTSPGPLTKFGLPSGQSSRVGSPASGSPVPNLPNDQQFGATTSRPPIGPLGSSDSRLQLLGSTSESANTVNLATTLPSKPSLPWPLSTQFPRPQLPTSTSTATTTSTSGTTMTTATSASGVLDTEESNYLLKEPGVMYILGEQNRGHGFTPGYGAGVGAGVGAGIGSGLGSGLGAGVGAGVAGLGNGPDLGVRTGPELGVANNENDNEEDDDSYLYDGDGGGETPSVLSAVASSNVLAAPTPQTPGSLRAYAGIAESEDSHYHRPDGQEKQSGTGQQYRPGPPVRRGTPMSFAGDISSVVPVEAAPKPETNTSPLIISKSPGPTPTPDRQSPSRLGLGRKPSGARELGTPRHGSNLSPAHSHHSVHSGASVSNNIARATNASPVGGDRISTSSRAYTEDSVMEATVVHASRVMVGASSPARNGGTSAGQDDGGVGEEALAYLNFADGTERVIGHSTTSMGSTTTAVATPSMIPVPPPPEVFTSSIEPLKTRHSTVAGPSSSGPGGVSDPGETRPYTESSFAPSNKAAERKAKAKAQKDAQLAAVHKPGRANGKKKSMAGAWDSSEDEEEEEEEEEEDEDVDSDEAKRRDSAYKGKGSHQQLQIAPSGSASSSALGHGRSQLQPVTGGIVEPEVLSPSQLRPPRNLPQIPGRRSPGEENTHSRRIPSEQYMDNGRRTYYEEGPQIRTQAEAPMPGAQRQTIWTKVLDPGQSVARPQSEHASKETFVQLEPSETMTKAFALHGLLSVGMQDKEDRSAKRQEELARESGASLVNVPNKPPPPQSGLLGYVTAHERERKRDGGLGAALTEREREKRIAEERQRRLDEQQRQQLDQMQQGMMFNPMMNPMMMNMMMNMNPMMTGGGGLSPMMTGGGMGGMNPMMTGGGMGMNPMMSGYGGMMGGGGGYSPQHMFAAQQAAQAYQQAMTAFSVAGSQVGGPGAGNGAEGGGPTSQGQNALMSTGMTGMSPGMGGMMNPAMSGNMGFDPRMSMFGMNNMMGMGMGMPSMGMGGSLGPQMTGMSNFDAMASPALGFANPGGGGMVTGMNTSPNANDLGGGAGGGGLGGLGLQPPIMPHSQFSSRANSPAGRGSPKVSGPGNTTNGEYHNQQHERGRPSRPASPK